MIDAIKKFCENVLKFELMEKDYTIMKRGNSVYVTVKRGNYKIKSTIELNSNKKIIIWYQVLFNNRSIAYKSVLTGSKNFTSDFEKGIWWCNSVINKRNKRKGVIM